MTLGTARGLGRVGWDALGQWLLVEFLAGPPDALVAMPVVLTPEVAEALVRELQTALSETAPAGGTA